MKLNYLLTCLVVLLLSGCSTSKSPTLSSATSLTNRPAGETAWVCAYQVPTGWVILDMITNYSMCGGGMHNVWQIENLNGMAVNSEVTCCTDSVNPAGWIVTGYSTNYGRCGGNAQNNIKTIRKLSLRKR
jgi:uncharacterized protein YbdZ (MbtH family)